MRRGRALQPHPRPFQDDSGRWIASRQAVAATTGRHLDFISRHVPVVACHIPTGCLLVDLADVEVVLAARPARRKAQDVA